MRRPINYRETGKMLLAVEELPQGALVRYERDVRATGPVCRYRDETKSAASKEGRAEAKSPYWAGIPASSA